MAESLSGVNGAIIRWARVHYHMNPDEAAQAIGVTLERYNAWEDGTDFPTYAKLKKISDVFHKPSAIFFFPTPPDIPMPTGDLRTLPDEVISRFSKNTIVQFERAKTYQLYLQELYGERESIMMHRADFPVDVQRLCDYFREQMQFPIAAQKARKSTKVVFEIFREKFYELGIYVFKDAFKDNSISGLCLNDNQFPVIIINNAMSFARQTFTLFHELYHLIADTSGAEIIRDDYYIFLDQSQTTIEKRCDEFANAFLVPMPDFVMELAKEPLSEQRIVDLANVYSVSREAIMYKLWQMGKITSDDYTALKESFYGEAIRNGKKPDSNDKQPRGNYYATKMSYLGTRYAGDVFKQYFAGKITSVKAGEMLNSKVDHLPKLEMAFFRGVKS